MKSIYQRHIKCENSIFYETITNANASVTATVATTRKQAN